MAATVYQPHCLGLVNCSEEKDLDQSKHKKSRHASSDLLWKEYHSQWWDYRNRKVGSTHPDFKHKTTKESLWIDGWYNPSWIAEELRSKGMAMSTQGHYGELHKKIKGIHDEGTIAVAMPLSRELPKSKKKVIQDKGSAFVALLRDCARNKDLHRGTRIHDDVLKKGLLERCSDALVTMYAKCGRLAKAKELLDTHKIRDVSSWSALIAGYARQGQSQGALNCFEQMQHEGLSPNAVTFSCVLKVCGSIKAIKRGKQIHDEIAKRGLLRNDVVLGTALADMYAKCGALPQAQQVLEELPSRDVVSWNVLIATYAQQGQGEQALKFFERMQHESLSPDAVTFACILKACGTIGAAEKGKLIHDEIARRGLLGDNAVLGTALVDMYAKCGDLAKAKCVLEELPSRDVVSWNALIAGYAQQGQGEQVLNCFKQMQCEGLSPDTVTFSCILKACGTLGAVDKGEQIHDEVAKQGLLGNNAVLGTALVDMYAKCGALAKAEKVLEELPSRDVVSWTALIAGYAQQGQGEQALDCFERMQCEGIIPNAVTFSCALNVCSHLGLVEDAYMYFVNMSTKYGVKLDLELYTGMIDLFGRAGHLERVVRVIQEMPFSDFSAVWHALLGACRKWGDVEIGRWAFEQAVQVDKSDGAAYVLMANIYAAAGMQENAKDIEAMRLENRAWKKQGRSYLSGVVHAFSDGDIKQHKKF